MAALMSLAIGMALLSASAALGEVGRCAEDVGTDDPALLQSTREQAQVKRHAASEQHGLEAKSKSEAVLTRFVKYYNYAGPLDVSGVSLVYSPESEQVIGYRLRGVDPACSSGPGTAKNSCGVHIHGGTSCAKNALGHYWAKHKIPKDPWATVAYTSVPGDVVTASMTNVPVLTGLYEKDVDGHTLIIHDYTGARIACAVIGGSRKLVDWAGKLTEAVADRATLEGPPANVIDFVKYYGYEGPLEVSGSVRVLSYRGGTTATMLQELEWALNGVDPACSRGPGDAANSCGVHIHKGTSCEASALGHYWNKGPVTKDPWHGSTYTSAVVGDEATSWGKVLTGLTMADVKGHAVIVHDYTGARIACGTI